MANNIFDHMLRINAPNIATSIFLGEPRPALMWARCTPRLGGEEFPIRPPWAGSWQGVPPKPAFRMVSARSHLPSRTELPSPSLPARNATAESQPRWPRRHVAKGLESLSSAPPPRRWPVWKHILFIRCRADMETCVNVLVRALHPCPGRHARPPRLPIPPTAPHASYSSSHFP